MKATEELVKCFIQAARVHYGLSICLEEDTRGRIKSVSDPVAVALAKCSLCDEF